MSYVHVYTYGWMHGWMNGWMDGCIHRRVHGWMDGQTNGWIDGWSFFHYCISSISRSVPLLPLTEGTHARDSCGVPHNRVQCSSKYARDDLTFNSQWPLAVLSHSRIGSVMFHVHPQYACTINSYSVLCSCVTGMSDRFLAQREDIMHVIVNILLSLDRTVTNLTPSRTSVLAAHKDRGRRFDLAVVW